MMQGLIRIVRHSLGACALGAALLGATSATTAADPPVGPVWKRQIGTTENDSASAAATDPAGNIYLTGQTQGSWGGAISGFNDVWIAKYTAGGQQLWIQQFGNHYITQVSALATDTAGNLYLSGYTTGSFVGTNRGGWDTWIAKYDADGNQLWIQQFGSSSYDYAVGVATDAAGNVYLSGYTWGSLNGVPNDHGTDAWVAKYDSDGNRVWIRQFGIWRDVVATGLASDAEGNTYLIGYTDGSLLNANRGGDDVWLVKYDTNGTQMWKRQFGTPNLDQGWSVATDTAGGVVAAGKTSGVLGSHNRGLNDAWVAKYAADGHRLWIRQLGTTESDFETGVTTDTAGSVYLTGETWGTLGHLPNRGQRDAWLAKYNGEGRLMWTRQLGSRKHDYASGVATHSESTSEVSIYLTGSTWGWLGGGSQIGYQDAWVAKYTN